MSAEIQKPGQLTDVSSHVGALLGNKYIGPSSGELRNVPMPDNFINTRIGITQYYERKSHINDKLVQLPGVGGFEDIVGEPLGVGFYYNTAGTIYQLAIALSLSQNPAIAEGLTESKTPEEIIKEFREGQVLAGLKVLDLGCGKNPSFALAAKAMGAEVYTADAEDLSQDIKGRLDGHVVVNFNDPEAAEEITGVTGGQFDLVTENIVDALPFSGTTAPESEAISRIGGALLKEGGHAFFATSGGQEKFLQKV